MKKFSQIPKPKAILFDNDGVLVSSEPLHLEAWQVLLPELGIPYDPADIHPFVGTTGPRVMAEILDKHRPGWKPEQFNLEALALRKNDIYLEIVRTKLTQAPGVLDGLKWLRSLGVKTAVVTNAKRREMESSLQIVGLWDLLDEKISRDDAGRSKPDPTPYLMAAAALGFLPQECVAVEDSPSGLESALMSGAYGTAVTTTFSRSHLESPVPGRLDLKPVWIGASMVDFFAMLNQKVGATF